MIDVLIADDEEPALDALEFLLRADPRVGTIVRAGSGAAALRALGVQRIDAVFLDIHMPGLTGFDLAHAMNQFAAPPAIVFVTADEERAVGAFDLDATDFLLKPVRQERLDRAVTRIEAALGSSRGEVDRVITVTRGAILHHVRRSEVRYAQAQGDYVRLHTDGGSHLLRTTLGDLAGQWADAGFVRVHRSYLVAVASITGVRVAPAPAVLLGALELPVSRRLLPAVREAFESAGRRP